MGGVWFGIPLHKNIKGNVSEKNSLKSGMVSGLGFIYIKMGNVLETKWS